MAGYMDGVNRAIRSGVPAVEAELARQRTLLEQQTAKRWDRATPPRSRFAVAAHITKTEHKISRLESALAERSR